MKYLRQYIRKILLTEAMKTPADLPDDIVVVIDADSKEASIYYGLANNPSEYAPELKPELYGLSSTDYMGAIDIYSPAKGLFYPWYGNCGDAWMVGGSAAEEGFGIGVPAVAASGMIAANSAVGLETVPKHLAFLDRISSAAAVAAK